MLIYIEGNIGSGKSTFANLLNQYYNKTDKKIIQEPVDQWLELKDTEGVTILDNFYRDQDKWSFPFQMNSFISRVNLINETRKNNPGTSVFFVERSVFTDKYCFAKNLYESGKINKIEWDIYTRWHSWLVENFKVEPDAYIYLKTDPEISHQRIKKRCREGEDGIPIEYLKELHNKHEVWMADERNIRPVVTLEVTKDFTNSESMESFVNEINKIIK